MANESNGCERLPVTKECHFLDADARLNAMREHDTDTQANGGDSGDDPVPFHFQCARCV